MNKKVKYYHFHHPDTPRGGATAAYIPDMQVVGIALCSLRDNFSRALGRTIARGRALRGSKSSRLANVFRRKLTDELGSKDDLFVAISALVKDAAEKAGRDDVIRAVNFQLNARIGRDVKI